MAASYTDKDLEKKVRLPSTARASLGRRCEDLALHYFLGLGWKLIRRNWHLSFGEIDLLFEDREGRIRLIEVRGRTRCQFRPSQFLPWAKQKRLLKLGLAVSCKFNRTVVVELAEVLDQKVKVYRLENPP